MIGICMPYRRCDVTMAGIALMRYLESVGRRYSVITYGWRAKSVDPRFDNTIQDKPFKKWLRSVKHIVWLMMPDDYMLDHLANVRCKHTLYTSWDNIQPHDDRIFSLFNYILLPTGVQAIQVRERLKVRNTAILPYHCGYPITKKQGRAREVRLFLSLYGPQLKRVDAAAVLALGGLMQDYSQLSVTVACSRGLSPYTVRDIRRFERQFPQRWVTKYNSPWHQHATLMGNSDLTIWPARWDGFGVIADTSLHMGTPVMTWDIPPMNEHISGSLNGVMVSCDLEYDWLGMPRVTPDYNEFSRVLRWLLDTPDVLPELKRHTHDALVQRYQDFTGGWAAVLPPE